MFNMKAPRTSRASLVKGSSRSVANTEAQRALIAHWQGIVKSLGNFLNTLKANHVSRTSLGFSLLYYFCLLSLLLYLPDFSLHFYVLFLLQVPPFLVRKVFTQIFSFINVQLFNRY